MPAHVITSEQQRDRMLHTPIPRLILSLCLPTLATQLISVFYNTADTYFVSKLSTSASAAVGVVFSLMSIIQAFGFGIGMGCGSIISRSLGGRDNDRADRIGSSAFVFAAAVGLALCAAGLCTLRPLMRLLGSTDTILPYAESYARIILLAAPVMCASFVLSNVLRAEGEATLSMYGMCVGGLLNVGLDPLFIFVFEMGIAGAALATALSQLVSFLILGWQFLHGRSIVRLRLQAVSRSPRDYGQILLIGFPTICRQGFASLSSALLNNAAAAYSDAAVAAVTISNKVYLLVRSMIIGIGQGFQRQSFAGLEAHPAHIEKSRFKRRNIPRLFLQAHPGGDSRRNQRQAPQQQRGEAPFPLLHVPPSFWSDAPIIPHARRRHKGAKRPRRFRRGLCKAHGSDDLDHAHLGSVAATGSELVNAGVATGALLFLVALFELGAIFAEELLHHGILDVLGALLPVGLVLVLALHILELIEVAHHQAAGMQLAGGVVDHVEGHELALVVMGFLGDFHGVIALIDRKRDQALGGTAHFLGAGLGRLDAAIPNQVGHLIAQKRLALSGRAAKFTLISHFVYPPITARLLQIRFFTRHTRSLLRLFGGSGLACRAHISLRRDLDSPFGAMYRCKPVLPDYSSLARRARPRAASFCSTSSRDFLPRLRTFIMSS